MTDALRRRRAFLAGFRHGRSLARKRARHEIEDLMDELHAERDDIARYQSIVRFDPEEPQD